MFRDLDNRASNLLEEDIVTYSNQFMQIPFYFDKKVIESGESPFTLYVYIRYVLFDISSTIHPPCPYENCATPTRLAEIIIHENVVHISSAKDAEG